MEKNLVSIIIPTFNRAHFVTLTLNSIANQTYTKFECLVIDDGSTDNTQDILIEFCAKDTRFKYIVRPQELPKGANSCRNIGISKSTGEFVAFCDDDDWWIDNKLELQHDIFKKHSGISVVTGDVEYVESEGERTNRIKSHWPDNHGYVFEKFLIKNRTSMVTPMLRRNVFNKVGNLNTNFIIAEDWEFWRRLSYFYEFYSINKVLAYVRLHRENISNTRISDPFENYKLYRKLTKSLLAWGQGKFEKAEFSLIFEIEWQHYRKIMSNQYPGFFKKISFLKQVFVHDFKDGFHLLVLFLKYQFK